MLTPYLHNHTSLGNNLNNSHSIHFLDNNLLYTLAWKKAHRYKKLLFLLQSLLKSAGDMKNYMQQLIRWSFILKSIYKKSRNHKIKTSRTNVSLMCCVQQKADSPY